jgi:hypothetical protein
MKSLIIKTAAVSIAIVASGLTLSAFSAHQTKVKNDKIVAEVTELATKATSDLDKYLRRAELGLVPMAEAGARCNGGNEGACEMVGKYVLVQSFGESPHPSTGTPSPMIETRAKCAANGPESDACIELALLQEEVDKQNQRILDSRQ